MPDTPQRIATDTSQKLPIRFGETIKAYLAKGEDVGKLTFIPLVLAGWLRQGNRQRWNLQYNRCHRPGRWTGQGKNRIKSDFLLLAYGFPHFFFIVLASRF